jgi:glycerol-3-phosphate dehydrogenase
LWHIHLERADGSRYSIRARALVNAAGPWVARFIRDDLKQQSPYGIRLIQGSHIVVPRLFDGEQAYILQNEDRRIVFAIPYLERFTLIGTTDREYQGDPAQVAISDEEIDYLLAVVNTHFKRPLSRADILHTYAGVRPLCDDESDEPSAITRDYTLSLSGHPGEAPLLSVFGGKLTTYRKLAEAALAQLAPHFPKMGPSWTATSLLPGAEQLESRSALVEALCARFGWLPTALARRWASTYGSRSWLLLKDVHEQSDLGEHLGGGLYAREVDYLCQEEWAMDAADILWRRTKLGLFMTPVQQARLEAYLAAEHPRKLTEHVA